MRTIELGPWTLEVDREATEAAFVWFVNWAARPDHPRSAGRHNERCLAAYEAARRPRVEKIVAYGARGSSAKVPGSLDA